MLTMADLDRYLKALGFREHSAEGVKEAIYDDEHGRKLYLPADKSLDVPYPSLHAIRSSLVEWELVLGHEFDAWVYEKTGVALRSEWSRSFANKVAVTMAELDRYLKALGFQEHSAEGVREAIYDDEQGHKFYLLADKSLDIPASILQSVRSSLVNGGLVHAHEFDAWAFEKSRVAS